MAGGFGLAYAAGGAADALTEIVKQRMLEQQQARLQQEQDFNQWLQTQQNARAQQLADQEAQKFQDAQDQAKFNAAQLQYKLRTGLSEAQQPGDISAAGSSVIPQTPETNFQGPMPPSP